MIYKRHKISIVVQKFVVHSPSPSLSSGMLEEDGRLEGNGAR